MIQRRFAYLLVLAFVFSAGAREASAAFITTGVYDEQVVQTNAVDRSATSDANPNEISLATFKTLVANAFAANLGGVMDFESHSTLTPPQTGWLAKGQSFAASYGVSQSRTISITHNGNGALSWTVPASGRTPISGSYVLARGTESHFDFLFDAADKVSHVGATLLSRGGVLANNVSAVAYFSGGGSKTVATTIAGSQATDDTFFGFVAPTGQSITRLYFGTSQFTNVDDFGFVVVPEPSSMLLLLSSAAAGLGMFRRRPRPAETTNCDTRFQTETGRVDCCLNGRQWRSKRLEQEA